MKILIKHIFFLFILSFLVISCGNSTSLLSSNNVEIVDSTLTQIPKNIVNIKLHPVQMTDSVIQGSNINFNLYVENNSDKSLLKTFYITAYLQELDSTIKKWLYSWQVNEVNEKTILQKPREENTCLLPT